MIKDSIELFTTNRRILLLISSFIFAFLFIVTVLSIIDAPHDYLQGIYVKIMYIHVPSAWLAVLLYIATALLSLFYIIYKNPHLNLAAFCLAKLGTIFTLIALITGAIWGKPTWGTWWVWDARLTSMLLMFFIYLGYISLQSSHLEHDRKAYISAIFAIFGAINIPIIKFSVYLWNTLHQGTTFFREGGASIHPEMLKPLIASTLLLIVYSFIIFILSYNSGLSKKKIERIKSISGN